MAVVFGSEKLDIVTPEIAIQQRGFVMSFICRLVIKLVLDKLSLC